MMEMFTTKFLHNVIMIRKRYMMIHGFKQKYTLLKDCQFNKIVLKNVMEFNAIPQIHT